MPSKLKPNEISINGACTVEELDKGIAEFFRQDGSWRDQLNLSLVQCSFIDLASLMWLISFLSSRNREALSTKIRLPQNKDVRDFLIVWEFPRAVRHATGMPIEFFLDDRSLKLFQEEFNQGFDKIKYASEKLMVNGIERRLLSEGFFEIITFTPRKVKSPSHLADNENSRWQDDRIVSILNRHLNRPGSTVASHIVHEAMMNSLKHPDCRIIQTCSFFDRSNSYLLSHRYGISKWRPFFSTLNTGRMQKKPTPVKRLWEFLPNEIKDAVENAPKKIPLRKDWGIKVKNSINKVICDPDFYSQEYFLDINLSQQFKNTLKRGFRKVSNLECQKLNRKLIEYSFPEAIASMPDGLFTMCYWDDGESIVHTLLRALEDGKTIRSIEAEELYNDYQVTLKDENDNLSDTTIIRSDFLPTKETREEYILLASIFPGITRDVTPTEKTSLPEVYRSNRLLGLPGMGLYVLTNEAIDVFGGRVSLRTKDLSLKIRGERFKNGMQNTIHHHAEVKHYGSKAPNFKGNLLTIRLPLRYDIA